MSGECDHCGLEDPYCKCYEQGLEKRIVFLEEQLDKLTSVVAKINDYLEIEEEMKKFTQGFAYRKKINDND